MAVWTAGLCDAGRAMSESLTVPEEALRGAVEAATLAPSLHNSQPWWFHLVDGAIEVHADPSRNPTVVDPHGREMHIGCGAASGYADLALRGMGWAVRTTVLPDGDNSDLVARVEATGSAATSDEDRRLVDMLPIRYTDRGRYD